MPTSNSTVEDRAVYFREGERLDREAALGLCVLVPDSMRFVLFERLGQEGDTSDYDGIRTIAHRDPTMALAVLEDHVRHDILASPERLAKTSEADLRSLRAFDECLAGIQPMAAPSA